MVIMPVILITDNDDNNSDWQYAMIAIVLVTLIGKMVIGIVIGDLKLPIFDDSNIISNVDW